MPGPVRYLWELACRRWAAKRPQHLKGCAHAWPRAVPVGAGLPAMGRKAAPTSQRLRRCLALCSTCGSWLAGDGPQSGPNISKAAPMPGLCSTCGSWLAGDGPQSGPNISKAAPMPGPVQYLWELACRRWAAERPQHLKGCADAWPRAAPMGAGLPAMGRRAAPKSQRLRRCLALCSTCGSWLAGDGPQSGPNISKAAPMPGPVQYLWELACRRWAAKRPQHLKGCADAWPRAVPVGAGLPAMGRKAAPKSQRLRSSSSHPTNRSINAPRRLRGGSTA
ncbi:Uncharacterised protein [Pseudomonas putida]|nr:Uncharacterised protein [Pseudomonas putida]